MTTQEIETFNGTVLGYKIERTGISHAPYRLTGPRGAVRDLHRNIKRPDMLYVVAPTAGVASWNVKGWEWFREIAPGHLEPTRW